MNLFSAKQDVFPRSYQYDLDCVKYRRRHACDGLKEPGKVSSIAILNRLRKGVGPMFHCMYLIILINVNLLEYNYVSLNYKSDSYVKKYF